MLCDFLILFKFAPFHRHVFLGQKKVHLDLAGLPLILRDTAGITMNHTMLRSFFFLQNISNHITLLCLGYF